MNKQPLNTKIPTAEELQDWRANHTMSIYQAQCNELRRRLYNARNRGFRTVIAHVPNGLVPEIPRYLESLGYTVSAPMDDDLGHGDRSIFHISF